MPRCSHCESFVTSEFVRVLGVDGEVHACPHCEDRKPSAADEGGWRSTRAPKEGAREYTTYDSEYATDGGQS